MMSYDNAKACAVVEAPSSASNQNSNSLSHNLDSLDDDQPETLVSDANPKGNQFSNNHYGEKGQ